MTKAYEKGFMDKCAECGVDGSGLLKQAQGWGYLGKALDVGKWWPKYIDLLKGGAKQRKAIAQAFKSKHGTSLNQHLRNFESMLAGGQFPKEQAATALRTYLNSRAPLDQLASNVLMARLATGGALTAGGLYGVNKLMDDGQPKAPVPPSYLG